MTPGDVVPFGTLEAADAGGRRAVDLVPMRSSALAVSVLTLGATLRSVEAPDAAGHLDHVALHLPTLADHEDRTRNPYLGATCGRYANRIGRAAFLLDGAPVHLAPNEGRHHLHGGPEGFDRRVWDLIEVSATDDGGRVVLGLTSPHGDQGYPGTLQATATYELHGHQLVITYEATTDAPTVVNLVNHTYWNLGGAGRWAVHRSIADHELRVPASHVLPVDQEAIPAPPLAPVEGTPLDLRHHRPLHDVLAARPDGIDHAYAVPDDPASAELLHDGLRPAAELHHGASGRTLTVRTDQPAVQVYTANRLDVPFARQAAVCLEPQRYPDAPNRPELGPAVLRPGEHHRATTELTFGVR